MMREWIGRALRADTDGKPVGRITVVGKSPFAEYLVRLPQYDPYTGARVADEQRRVTRRQLEQRLVQLQEEMDGIKTLLAAADGAPLEGA